MSKLSEINEQYEAAKKRFKDEGKAALADAFGEFFAKHPEATAILWTQYTPYFNDGDVCTFSVHEWELRVDPEYMPEAARSDYRDAVSDGKPRNREAGYRYGEGNAVDVLRRAIHGDRWFMTDAPLPEPYCHLVADFRELEDSCPKDLLESVLGDHVQVRATKSGFQVDDYRHD